MAEAIAVVDQGERLAFAFEDMLRYSGPGRGRSVTLALRDGYLKREMAGAVMASPAAEVYGASLDG